jgi:hypothetical protein
VGVLSTTSIVNSDPNGISFFLDGRIRIRIRLHQVVLHLRYLKMSNLDILVIFRAGLSGVKWRKTLGGFIKDEYCS